MNDNVVQSFVSLLQGKKLFIFDFDGTIADTSPLHAAAFERVLLPHGLTVHYPSIAGMRTADAIMSCAAECRVVLHEEQLDNLVTAKQTLVREMIQTQILPLPGVDRFLSWAQHRYELSMATSGSRPTVSLALERLGYGKWFDPLVCAEDVERAKPHPDVFQTVLQMTGCSPDAALVFEDSDAGLMAANAARVDYVHVKAETWNTIMEGLQ